MGHRAGGLEYNRTGAIAAALCAALAGFASPIRAQTPSAPPPSLLVAPVDFSQASAALTLKQDASSPRSSPSTQPSSPPAAPSAAPSADAFVSPLLLDDDDESQNVYAPIQPQEDQGFNQGAAHIDIDAMYFNHYVYRGVDHSKVGGTGNSTNLEIDARLTFDLGNLPHPYVGVFNNVYDSDPVSRFQEIRPYFGADWMLRPLILSAGQNTYIYPNREDLNTAEFWGQITLDDSFLFHTGFPLFSPYFYGAYDYSRNDGWYFQAGVHHDFSIEDTGLTLSPYADVGYILGYQQQFIYINNDDSGFQHYDVGLNLTYSLNTLFNISRRFGEFDIKASFNCTGKLQNSVTADNIIWGGIGIGFSY